MANYIREMPFFESHVKTQTAVEAYADVLANVGSNVPALEDHDHRILAEVRNGTCRFRESKTGLPGLPDSHEDVGGWEHYTEVHRPANWDTDRDGMPDAWETARGLSPADASDGNADRDDDANLEEYLGSVVGEFAGQEKQW